MAEYPFAPAPRPSVAIADSSQRFPVRRIYCVGRNYADHVREMGNDPKLEPPVFFQKPADAIVEAGQIVPYPSRTQDFHHEVELVVALGNGGRELHKDAALECVFGYAIGNDFTRRDLQKQAKAAGQPWDASKGFDHAAGIGPIHPASRCGHLNSGLIRLAVNDAERQHADLREMIWSVPDIIVELSALFELRAGDLIYTGTPAGVGPLRPGDRVECEIAGLGKLKQTIGWA